MNDWWLRKITDYWDYQVGAVFGMAKRLEVACRTTYGHQRARDEIATAVSRQVGELSDDHLALVAFAMVEDLYKSAASLTYWDEYLSEYLALSARTFGRRLSERGFTLHYLVDNTFEASETGLSGPTIWYPKFFRSAGFAYICPQEVARTIMAHDKRDPAAFVELLPVYIDEARYIARQAVRRLHEQGDHYCHLDTDWVETSFEVSMEARTLPGVITVFRNEAPAKGSKSQVTINPPRRGRAETAALN
jgi:hypothetical protein